MLNFGVVKFISLNLYIFILPTVAIAVSVVDQSLTDNIKSVGPVIVKNCFFITGKVDNVS